MLLYKEKYTQKYIFFLFIFVSYFYFLKGLEGLVIIGVAQNTVSFEIKLSLNVLDMII
jgi:hypothetical protein